MPLILKWLLHLVVSLLCGLPLLCGQQLTSDGRTVHTVHVGNDTRHFTVHTPNRVASSVVLLLHPTTEAKDDQPLAPAIAFENSIPGRFAQWYETGAVLVFLASRQVVDRGGKKYCWGVGTDNGLCSAPLEGKEDEMFVLQVLDWLERKSSPLPPTYLFGWSGGGRMAWRLACNNTLAPRFMGIAASSSLLAAALRAAPTSCSVATSPPLVLLHGTDDTTTPVNFGDASVAWTSSKAACASVLTANAVGQQPLSERQVHGECGAARTCFALVYYRQQQGHDLPSAYWFSVIWQHWSKVAVCKGNLRLPRNKYEKSSFFEHYNASESISFSCAPIARMPWGWSGLFLWQYLVWYSLCKHVLCVYCA